MGFLLQKNEPCPACGRYDNRGISVDAVVIKNGKVLLIKRGIEPFKGHWALVGGYMNWDESAEQSIKRELLEEIGIKVLKMRFLATYTDPGRHTKQVITIAFVIDKYSGKPRESGEVMEVKWFNKNQIPENLAFDHKKILNDAIKTGSDDLS